MALLVCGLLAGASGVAIFKAEPDPDPRDAMALAPAETLGSTAPVVESLRRANSPKGHLKRAQLHW
jgi:hypothetical protein